MNIIEEAFRDVYPNRNPSEYEFYLQYSGRFSDFNANVKKQGHKIIFGLSKRWRHVDKDIKKGLLQELMCKIFGDKKQTHHLRLYHLFTKNMHRAALRTDSHPDLIESFNRVNEGFFYGLIEMPNLKFGKNSMSTMGSYNFHNDTITISRLLEDEENTLIDYIMYHELLHKKLKFKTKNGRSYHHTSEFRKKEKEFPEHKLIEKRLSMLSKNVRKKVKKGKIKNWFSSFIGDVQ